MTFSLIRYIQSAKIYQMNQNPTMIKLAEITGSKPFLSGNTEGRRVLQKLQEMISPTPGESVIGISLKGIQATDASFPREGVISLIKMLCGEVGIFLRDFSSADLMDNWDYAAKAKNQAVIVLLEGSDFRVIGPSLSQSAQELLRFIMAEGTTTTSRVSAEFDISAQNASARLKKLHAMGLVLATKEVAESGGMEYVYRAIK